MSLISVTQMQMHLFSTWGCAVVRSWHQLVSKQLSPETSGPWKITWGFGTSWSAFILCLSLSNVSKKGRGWADTYSAFMVRKKTGNSGELVSVTPNNMDGNHGFLPETLQLFMQTGVRRGALVVTYYCNSRALFTLKHVEDEEKTQNKQNPTKQQTNEQTKNTQIFVQNSGFGTLFPSPCYSERLIPHLKKNEETNKQKTNPK